MDRLAFDRRLDIQCVYRYYSFCDVNADFCMRLISNNFNRNEAKSRTGLQSNMKTKN